MITEQKERALAYVSTIDDIQPIDGADRIVVASLKGWKAVVKKGDFNVGDKCVYIECDSVLPKAPWAEFLADKKNPDKPIRVRTIRLRGQLSQGLVFPLNVLGEYAAQEGDDLTQKLGLTKYEAPIPACLAGQVYGDRPSFFSKSDEERCQNFPDIFKEIAGIRMYKSVKCDGTSGSFFYKADNWKGTENIPFGVCSRNLWLKPSDSNTYWQMAKKYNLQEKLEAASKKFGKAIVCQGECVGEGIQGNRMGIKGHDLLIFNVFLVEDCKYLDYADFIQFCKDYDLKTVPIEDDNFMFDGNETVDDVLAMADGVYDNGHLREGIVFRPVIEQYSPILKGRLSFKAVSNQFLEKIGE